MTNTHADFRPVLDAFVTCDRECVFPSPSESVEDESSGGPSSDEVGRTPSRFSLILRDSLPRFHWRHYQGWRQGSTRLKQTPVSPVTRESRSVGPVPESDYEDDGPPDMRGLI